MTKAGNLLAQGRTAELYEYGEDRVLKLFRIGFPVDMAAEEFRIARIVHSTGMHAPEPFGLVDCQARKGIVYEKAAGPTMLAAMGSDPARLERESERMAEIHARIHQARVEGLPSQKGVLRDRIRAAPGLGADEKARIIGRLSGLREDARLCHGDFHPDNIIVGDRVWTIDWMTGMVGNPAGDVARTSLLLAMGQLPDEAPEPVVQLLTRLRERLLEGYLNAYLALSRISRAEIEEWSVPVAAARLVEWIPEEEKERLTAYIRERI